MISFKCNWGENMGKQVDDDSLISIFLLKPTVKVTIISVLTILLGIVTSLITSWQNDTLHWILFVVMLLICIGYILIMIYYATKETNLHKAYGEIKKQNEAYAQIMVNLATTFRINSNSINLVARYFNEEEKSSHLNWHFDTICQSLCREIYEVVCRIAENGDDFSVSYIKRIDDGTNDDIVVKMIAYYNCGLVQPHIYDKERCIKEDNPFLDLRIFDESNPDPKVLATPAEIIKAGFKYNSEEDREKYKQYIGIPVFCTGTHMDGLLQVVVMHDSKLKSKKCDLEYFARKTLITYAHLFLLFSKIDKIILSKQKFMEENHETK